MLSLSGRKFHNFTYIWIALSSIASKFDINILILKKYPAGTFCMNHLSPGAEESYWGLGIIDEMLGNWEKCWKLKGAFIRSLREHKIGGN